MYAHIIAVCVAPKTDACACMCVGHLVPPQVGELRAQGEAQQAALQAAHAELAGVASSRDAAVAGARHEGALEAEAVARRQVLQVQRQHDEELSKLRHDLLAKHKVGKGVWLHPSATCRWHGEAS